MHRIQKHIEIVRSSRGPLVSLGKYSAEAIREVLLKQYQTVEVSIVNDISDLEALIIKNPDLVFLGMKNLPIREAGLPDLWVSSYLDEHGIAYTGSPEQAIEFESNKLHAKQQVLRSGLATAAYEIISKHDALLSVRHELKYPLFIKPLSLGGGHGIDDNSLVHSDAELIAKAKYIAERYNQDSLVEEYLPGREFSVAILKNEYTDELVAMPIELVAEKNINGDRILGKAAKSANKEQVTVVQDDASRKRVSDLALEVFESLGARDYGRVDIRMDAQGVPHFLEANLIPGLGNGHGYFPQACLFNAGLDYKTIILAITSLGLSRNSGNNARFSGTILSPLLDPYSSSPVLDTL